MNTESVQCRRRRDLPLKEGQKTTPGDFAWDIDMPESDRDPSRVDRYLYLHLPGQETWDAWRVLRGAQGEHRQWGWDGNEDAPTLTPSLELPGKWHGHLVRGVLISG